MRGMSFEDQRKYIFCFANVRKGEDKKKKLKAKSTKRKRQAKKG